MSQKLARSSNEHVHASSLCGVSHQLNARWKAGEDGECKELRGGVGRGQTYDVRFVVRFDLLIVIDIQIMILMRFY